MFKHQIELASHGFGITHYSNGYVLEQLEKGNYATRPNESGLVFLYTGGGDCFRMDGFSGCCFINRNSNWYCISAINTQYLKSENFVGQAQVKLYPCNGKEYLFNFDSYSCTEVESNIKISFSSIANIVAE